MTSVEHDGLLYALKISPPEDAADQGRTKWFGENFFSLQGSLMHYGKGSKFKEHRHKLNPRIINKTQECFVVVRGAIRVEVQPTDLSPRFTLEARTGEAIFVWGGWHSLEVLEEGTLAYEFKAGAWNGSVAEDKEFPQ